MIKPQNKLWYQELEKELSLHKNKGTSLLKRWIQILPLIVMPYLVQKSDISYKRQAYEQDKWDTVIICPFYVCSLFQFTVLSFSCHLSLITVFPFLFHFHYLYLKMWRMKMQNINLDKPLLFFHILYDNLLDSILDPLKNWHVETISYTLLLGGVFGFCL